MRFGCFVRNPTKILSWLYECLQTYFEPHLYYLDTYVAMCLKTFARKCNAQDKLCCQGRNLRRKRRSMDPMRIPACSSKSKMLRPTSLPSVKYLPATQDPDVVHLDCWAAWCAKLMPNLATRSRPAYWVFLANLLVRYCKIIISVSIKPRFECRISFLCRRKSTCVHCHIAFLPIDFACCQLQCCQNVSAKSCWYACWQAFVLHRLGFLQIPTPPGSHTLPVTKNHVIVLRENSPEFPRTKLRSKDSGLEICAMRVSPEAWHEMETLVG